MKTQNIYIQNTNFKSGLTCKIIKDIKSTNVAKAQEDFKKIGMNADFKGKQAICANFVYATNILYDLSEKFKLPFDFVPYAVRVYENKELCKPGEYRAFSINDTGKILTDEPSFIGGSIFFNSNHSGLFQSNQLADKDYKNGRRSSSHFLTNTLHEWFHTIHMDLMYKKLGYEGECPILRDEYHKEGVNNGLTEYERLSNVDLKDLPESFKRYIGSYAIEENSLLEVFAELMTKITTDSLDKNLNVIKNPLDNLPKDLPEKVKFELERTLDI